MKKKSPSEDWNDEYQAMLQSRSVTPPRNLSENLKKRIHADLNPSAWSVFCKLFAIHFVSGTFTLLFCPQFGMELHNQTLWLWGLFLKFGEYGCMLACGALFLGATGFFAALLLKKPEVRVISQSRGLQWALLAFLSIGFFLSFQEQESSIPLGLAVAWAVGAVFGGFFVFKVSYWFKEYLAQVNYRL